MAPVAYHRPATLADACALASRLGTDGVFLAGGSEVMLALRGGTLQARNLVSLRDVPGLAGISDDDGGLTIGAMTTLAEVADSERLRGVFPALCEAASSMAGLQVRNHATIGGNFCAAVPCADTPPPCMVAEARLRIVNATGTRDVEITEFFRGPRDTILQAGDIVIGIHIPAQPTASGGAYMRFSRRKANALAVASVAARVALADDGTIASARVALGAVAPVPWPAVAAGEILAGRIPDDSAFDEAGRIAAEESRPIDDVRGSVVQRLDLVQTLTVRALREATARATTASHASTGVHA